MLLEFPIEPESPPGCPFDPPPTYRQLLRRSGLSKARIWNGAEPWLIARYDEFREVCGNAADFSSDDSAPNYPYTSAGAKPLTRSLLRVDAPDHTRLRRPTAAFFAKRRMERISPAIEQLANDLIDQMSATGTSTDLIEDYAKPIPSLVVFQLLGLPTEERPRMHELLGVLFGAKTPEDQVRVASTAFESEVTRFVHGDEVDPSGMIAGLRKDVVSAGDITMDDLRDFVMILIVGGFESTANTLGEGVALLLLHPEQLADVRSDPSLWPNTVEEILRFTAVTHRGRRRVAKRESGIAGETIAEGDAIIALENAANRDPRKFEDPDVFDIHRKNARQHLAFGYGPHLCLGAPLARLELTISLRTLFERLPGLQLAVAPEKLEFMHDWHLRGLRSLPVTW